MTDPEITQADRDAVNAFHSASFTALFNNGSDKQTIGGNLNAAHALLLEAFARHRMLGRAEGAAQERAEIAQHILIAVGYFRDDMPPGSVKFFQDLADGLGNSILRARRI